MLAEEGLPLTGNKRGPDEVQGEPDIPSKRPRGIEEQLHQRRAGFDEHLLTLLAEPCIRVNCGCIGEETDLQTKVARFVQGRSETLSSLCEILLDELFAGTSTTVLDVRELVMKVASRHFYGGKSNKMDTNSSEELLKFWVWESKPQFLEKSAAAESRVAKKINKTNCSLIVKYKAFARLEDAEVKDTDKLLKIIDDISNLRSQLSDIKEKEEARKEKEKLRLEKDQEREQEAAKRRIAKEERELAREEREKAKEDARLERELAKELAQKEREEAKELAEQEKLKTKEEKQRLSELAKTKSPAPKVNPVLKKQQGFMMKFFKSPAESTPDTMVPASLGSRFRPWISLPFVKLAPIFRSPRHSFDLKQINSFEPRLDIKSLSSIPRPHRSSKKNKYFSIHTEYRPDYYGTFSKSSSVVSGRHPFAMDHALFNYEVDSDDEWEDEPDDAESVVSDGELDEDDDVDALGNSLRKDGLADDGWLMPEEEDVFKVANMAALGPARLIGPIFASASTLEEKYRSIVGAADLDMLSKLIVWRRPAAVPVEDTTSDVPIQAIEVTPDMLTAMSTVQ